MEQDEHVKRTTSSHASQYEWGIRIAPHLTQLVEPTAGYQLLDLLYFQNEQNSETGLVYFAPIFYIISSLM
jgi:hypothetical protein